MNFRPEKTLIRAAGLRKSLDPAEKMPILSKADKSDVVEGARIGHRTNRACRDIGYLSVLHTNAWKYPIERSQGTIPWKHPRCQVGTSLGDLEIDYGHSSSS